MENNYPKIYFREDKNLFYSRITYVDKLTGNKKRKTIYGISNADLKKKIDDFLECQSKNVDIDRTNKTISELIKEEADTDFKMNIIKESSYERRISILKIVDKHIIGKTKIKDVDKNIINSFLIYVVDCNYSNSTIKKVFMTLKRIVTKAQYEELIKENPFLKYNIKVPKSNKPNKKVDALTVEEQEKFTAIAENYIPKIGQTSNKRLQPLIELYSGMRMGEINALRLCDIDFDNKKINICGTIERGIGNVPFREVQTKTEAGMRKIPMNNKIERYLKTAVDEYIPNEEQLIFYDEKNQRPFTTQSINGVISSMCRRADIRIISSHTLRHTYATRLVEMKVPIKIVQNLLGHKDISITMNTYTSVLDDYQNSAMEIINDNFANY